MAAKLTIHGKGDFYGSDSKNCHIVIKENRIRLLLQFHFISNFAAVNAEIAYAVTGRNIGLLGDLT